jgi:uncharacterized protein (DUF342 family)
MDESTTTTAAQAAADGQATTATPETTETTGQEPKSFDAAYVQQLRNEAAKHRREVVQVAAKLKELEDASLTEAERTKKERDDAVAELARTKLDLLRARVAAKHNLPDVLANRLQGDDEQTMEADAKVLAKLVVPPASSGAAANGASGRGDRQLTRDQLRGMTAQQIAALDPAVVRAALSP